MVESFDCGLPAAIIGLPLNDWLDKHFYHFVPVAFMLIIYGVAFIVIERRWVPNHEFSVMDIDRLPYRAALYIGLFQVLSLLPGTSRSGATIVGALLIGVSREVSAEFTFFLEFQSCLEQVLSKFFTSLKMETL